MLDYERKEGRVPKITTKPASALKKARDRL